MLTEKLFITAYMNLFNYVYPISVSGLNFETIIPLYFSISTKFLDDGMVIIFL